MAGFDTVRWAAWVLVAAGLVWSGWRTLKARSWDFAPLGELSEGELDDEPGAVAPDKVALAAVLVIGVAFITTVLLPALDSSDEQPSSRAVTTRDYEAFADGAPAPQASVFLGELGLDPLAVAEGRELYVSEGCVYCHTQQVRANVADVGLGPVTLREDVMLASPALLGRIRLGPDLSHAGARPPTSDVAWVRDHLSDPRRDRGWSAMPSYDYLSDDELNALAQYIVSLH
jgi:mono/diheme cytochrome c family protein